MHRVVCSICRCRFVETKIVIYFRLHNNDLLPCEMRCNKIETSTNIQVHTHTLYFTSDDILF